MWNTLERYRDLGLLIIRLGFGLGFFWFHGWPKLPGVPSAGRAPATPCRYLGVTFAHQWWGLAAGVAEGLGGLLIALGLFFRPVTLALVSVMIVATTNHIASGEGTPAHAFKNAWLFAGLFFVGPGRFSLDHRLWGRR